MTPATRSAATARPAVVVTPDVSVAALRRRLSGTEAPTAVVVQDEDGPRTLDALRVLRTTADGDMRPATWLHCCPPTGLTERAPLQSLVAAALSRPDGHQHHDLAVTADGSAALISVDELVRASDARASASRGVDALTGLADRAGITGAIETALARDPSSVAVAFVDLDRFKEINDRFGHAIGDRVLATVAQRLANGLRGEDDIGRMGGDEFVALLRVRDAEDAQRIAQRMIDRVTEPVGEGPVSTSVGLSIGVTLGRRGRDATSMIADADALMYLAKQRGGGVLVAGDAEHPVVTRDQLRRVLAASGLRLRYQPIVPLDGSPSRALEALVRWPLGNGSTLSPSSFVPLAETTGQVVDLDWWALRTAVAQLSAWDRRQARPWRTHVNVSPRTLALPGLVSHIERLLADGDVEPSRLVLEVAESAVIADIDRSRDVLSALRHVGVEAAIDDFGVGQSSLAQLSSLPVTGLKIDRALVSRLVQRDVERSVIRLVRALADELDLDVIAEGVESVQQAEALQDLGVTHAQGWLWSPAVEAQDVDAWTAIASQA